MNKLDKKQIPQFAALCVLSAGAFGYFVVKIVTPSPAAAGTRPHPVTEAMQAPVTSQASPKQAEAGKTGAVPATPTGAVMDAPAGVEAEVPAPTPGMRDPFVVGYVDPATQPAVPAVPTPAKATAPAMTAAPQVASIREVKPASTLAPALPFGLKGFPAVGGVPDLPAGSKKAAAPEVLTAPAWTVTGVLQGEAGQMAVLRSGEARRIVRTGDFVDSVYRVVTVTRGAVVLRHGKNFYHLTLGTAKPATTAPAAPALTPASVPAPALTPAPVPVSEPQADALAPALPAVGLEAGLARMVQGALLMARSYMAPAQLQTDTWFVSAQAPIQEDAQTPLDQAPLNINQDVYGTSQAAGGAQWRCVAATNDLDTADEASMLPDRFI